MSRSTIAGLVSLVVLVAAVARLDAQDPADGRIVVPSDPTTPFTREVWLHALRQDPSNGEAAFGVTLEGIYHFASRAHDRWRRNTLAEVLARPQAMARVEIGYDPVSALITGGGGMHVSVEALAPWSDRFGGGGYARYDRAAAESDIVVTDFEAGAQVSVWSEERRTYLNEKLGYRRIDRDGFLPGIDEGGFLQLRHHLVYVPSEDWTLTFVQEGAGRMGLGSEPHTNALRIENLFLLSPTLGFSAGPMVGVNLEYFVGPATSALSVPVGVRFEAHPGLVVVAANASFDVATVSGQKTAGLILRVSAGLRF